jgi:rare lipoprotein A
MKIVPSFGVLAAFGMCLAAAGQVRDAGQAGYYGDWFDGKTMANGDVVDQSRLTASIGSYPFDTALRVTSLESGKSVVVRVTDRPGPRTNEVIVLTRAAAEELGFLDSGRTRVQIEVLEMGSGGRVEPAAAAEASARERRWKRGGLAEPGRKPSPFAYSEP